MLEGRRIDKVEEGKCIGESIKRIVEEGENGEDIDMKERIFIKKEKEIIIEIILSVEKFIGKSRKK